MKNFSDIKFNKIDFAPNGVQAFVNFGKYKLSIVKHDWSYGGKKGLYEIGVFGTDGNMVELPGVTHEGDTVKGFMTEDDVMITIKKMFTLTATEPKNVEYISS
jgi:hypothetical protein